MLVIGEFPGAISAYFGEMESALFFKAGPTLWRIDPSGSVGEVATDATASAFRVFDGALWWLYNKHGERRASCIDKRRGDLNSDFVAGLVSDDYVAYEQRAADRALCVAQLDGRVVARLGVSERFSYTCDAAGVVLRLRSGPVIALDRDLKERWRFESQKTQPIHTSQSLFCCGETVVVSLGGHPATNRDPEIVGIEARDGRPLWSRTFSAVFNAVATDRDAFIAVGREVLALDVRSGETRDATQLEEEAAFGDALAVAGERLLYANYDRGTVWVVDTKEMMALQRDRLPSKYNVHEQSRAGRLGGRWFVPLMRRDMNMRGAGYALCEVRAAQAASEPSAKFGTRPDSEVVLLNRGDEDVYRVSLYTVDPQQMRLFLPILAREVAQAYGDGVWEVPERNRRFRGLIEVCVCPEQVPMIDEIQALAAAVQSELEGLCQMGGDGQSPIVLNVVNAES